MARAYLLAIAEEQRQMNALRRQRRARRALSDPMSLSDNEFEAHFRLSKNDFNSLMEELRPYMAQRRRNTGVPHHLKVLSVVSFYAQGLYQKNVGSSYLFNMSQPTFSKCLQEVTNALNHPDILRTHIKFPTSQEERENIMGKFMEKFRFPGIIGCIDGTHVALIRPVEHEETFFNRKGYHSLNVMIICDVDLNILYVDSSFGGAAHDSFVWNQSPIKDYIEGLHNNREYCWLLGCIDGTHVALIRPVEHEETFFNRKGYHSLNVMIICDVDLNILYVDSSFGGAAHDSFVWNQSPIKDYIEGLHNNREYCWLLGDSGYAQRPFMMTPILGAAPNSPEEYYTTLHCRVRNTVERCIGVLKARWRCLLAHRVLHYNPTTSGKIVNACVVLHNIANAARTLPPLLPLNDRDNDQQRQPAVVVAQAQPADDARANLVDRLWRER